MFDRFIIRFRNCLYQIIDTRTGAIVATFSNHAKAITTAKRWNNNLLIPTNY